MNNFPNTSGIENEPYGTGPGFGANGSGPVFGPGNMGPGSDIPVGLGMLLMEDSLAMQRFQSMTKEEKTKILKYVESGADGDDAQRRINHTVKCLHDGVTVFY